VRECRGGTGRIQDSKRQSPKVQKISRAALPSLRRHLACLDQEVAAMIQKTTQSIACRLPSRWPYCETKSCTNSVF
jgi:hypothetical protein